jgi:hypothetical protein
MNDPDESLSIVVKRDHHSQLQPMAVYSTMRLHDVHYDWPMNVPFIPDVTSRDNSIAAAVHRYGRAMPRWDPEVMRDFVAYSKAFIVANFVPLNCEDVKTFSEWLESTPYSEKRRKELALLRNQRPEIDRKTVVSKAFIKEEGYPEPKNARAINSPSDESKALVGNLIHAIDKKTFSLPWFVKGSDPRDWPRKLADTLGGARVMETDFSSFEAHHRGEFSKLVLFWIMHMIRRCGFKPWFKRLIHRMVLGSNTSEFKHIKVTVDQKLMSGAMWTSSSNGVLNLLIMSYLTQRTRHPSMPPEDLADTTRTEFRGFVEGDDGLCEDVSVQQSLIDALGLCLKFETHDNFAEASFCGIVCDPSELKIVKDPNRVLSSFFVLPRKYVGAKESVHRALLRAKALSYYYNFGDAPIVGALCKRVLDDTRGIDVRSVSSEMTERERHFMHGAIAEKKFMEYVGPSMPMRLLVERHFGISPERQMDIEQSLLVQQWPIKIDMNFVTPLQRLHSLNFTAPKGATFQPPPRDVPPLISAIVEGGLQGKSRSFVVAADRRALLPRDIDESALCMFRG